MRSVVRLLRLTMPLSVSQLHLCRWRCCCLQLFCTDSGGGAAARQCCSVWRCLVRHTDVPTQIKVLQRREAHQMGQVMVCLRSRGKVQELQCSGAAQGILAALINLNFIFFRVMNSCVASNPCLRCHVGAGRSLLDSMYEYLTKAA